MKDPIRVVQYGLGPIGQAIVKHMAKRREIRIVGAIDIDEKKVGRDLGALVEIDKLRGIEVSPNARQVLSDQEGQIVVLSTVSSLDRCFPQIREIVESSKHLISTCEELAYPWQTYPDLSKAIDNLAKAHRVAVLGTGVNPGFAMDYLPIVVSGLCGEVKRAKISRIQDAGLRRRPFQLKIGAGLTREEFEKRRGEKQIRHVGLTESIHMIASAFGWELDQIEEEIFPLVSEEGVESGFIKVTPGRVKGMRQVGRGLRRGEEILTLEMIMTLGQENPRDVIEIEGTPQVRLVFEEGIPGDTATAAVIVNSIPRLIELTPGLKTMLDMPPIHVYNA